MTGSSKLFGNKLSSASASGSDLPGINLPGTTSSPDKVDDDELSRKKITDEKITQNKSSHTKSTQTKSTQTKSSQTKSSQTKSSVGKQARLKRRWIQAGFFLLFVFAPILDIFRFDLNLGHFIIFGYPWTLGLDGLMSGQETPYQAALNLLLRGFLPLAGLVLFAGWVSWKYGRLYCGWLCPHFSVVEMINNLMRRATGKFSLWDKKEMSQLRADDSLIPRGKIWWAWVTVAVLGFSFLWAVVLITYLLPPVEIYGNLLSGELTMRQAIFISAATVALTIEFMFARHLFCRFGCAVGVFQSFVWMANKKALVVSFDRSRASACHDCHDACDEVCPMRLKPRTIKRSMFTCTQCGQCLTACEQVQVKYNAAPIIRWKSGDDALQESHKVSKEKTTRSE